MGTVINYDYVKQLIHITASQASIETDSETLIHFLDKYVDRAFLPEWELFNLLHIFVSFCSSICEGGRKQFMLFNKGSDCCYKKINFQDRLIYCYPTDSSSDTFRIIPNTWEECHYKYNYRCGTETFYIELDISWVCGYQSDISFKTVGNIHIALVYWL